MEGMPSSLHNYATNSTDQPNQDSSSSKLTLEKMRSESGIISNQTQPLDQFHQFYMLNSTKDKNQDPDPDPNPPQAISTPGASNSNLPLLQLQPQESDVASPIQCQYRECLKNHAVSIGGHVVDGCGEFTPGGEEGTPEALKCAACECHRNFHRREDGGESLQFTRNSFYSHNPNGINATRSRNHHIQVPQSAHRSNQHHHQHSHYSNHYSHRLVSPNSGPMMMAFGGRGPAESSSEDLNMFQSGGQHTMAPPSFSGSKKRFRTKFTQQQKDRMHEVAEKLGWKIQKEDDDEVRQLCQELDVKRQVFKVWMHNNKQAMKKKQEDQ